MAFCQRRCVWSIFLLFLTTWTNKYDHILFCNSFIPTTQQHMNIPASTFLTSFNFKRHHEKNLDKVLCMCAPDLAGKTILTNTQMKELSQDQKHKQQQKQLPQEQQEKEVQEHALKETCGFCQKSFTSRNALFRHLKSSPCSVKTNMDNVSSNKLIALALQFSYIGLTAKTNIVAEEAGLFLQDALKAAIKEYLSDQNDDDPEVSIVGSSQSSLARLRHRVLDQEPGCAAVADTMVVRIQARQLNFAEKKEESLFLNQLISNSNEYLNTKLNYRDGNACSIRIRLEACKLLSLKDGKLLHAEQMCTQRVYHYLLPLRWLPQGTSLERWWIDTAVPEIDGHTNKSLVRPPSDSLKRMKMFLRAAESERLDHIILNKEEESKWAAGRFGTLGEKKRKSWHNFADPELKGRASPNTKPVWRVLDRARFQLLFTRDGSSRVTGEKEVVAVLEFKGDDFLPQQIRRIVGTALAMTHGWIPENTMDMATRADCFLETPIAPEGRLYLLENRFHWQEMRTRGLSIFETDTDGISMRRTSNQKEDTVKKAQDHILDLLDDSNVRDNEERWLMDLQGVTCPRITNSLKEWENPDSALSKSHEKTHSYEKTPQIYSNVLNLLQDIVIKKKWPETSVARSSVISNVARNTSESIKNNGSFTVVNPKFGNGMYENGVGNDKLPLGNKLFPELVKAVFDLEKALVENVSIQHTAMKSSSISKRLPSSHCAINCNAQFTPHVDSGRGAGQSLSMIVGLGDYEGGDLGVEGTPFDIRYHPLEFDGWHLRHWTKPFQGERYSLVWFTPELKGDE